MAYEFVRNRAWRTVMKRSLTYLMSVLFAVGSIFLSSASAGDQEKDASRWREQGHRVEGNS